MKATEFERLKEAILNEIGVDNLKKLEAIFTHRKMSFKNKIDAFLLNVAKYTFDVLYQHQMHGHIVIELTSDSLEKYGDYIANHFTLWGRINIGISSRRGVLFRVDCFFADLDYVYYVYQTLPKKKNKLGNPRLDNQTQQFKCAARQGSRKK